jgi:hypothetical protein
MFSRKSKGLEQDTHSNFVLAKIRLKRLNAPSLISATDFGQTNAKIGRISPKLAEFFAQIGAQKTYHWMNFGQLGRYSTKISGGN